MSIRCLILQRPEQYGLQMNVSLPFQVLVFLSCLTMFPEVHVLFTTEVKLIRAQSM